MDGGKNWIWSDGSPVDYLKWWINPTITSGQRCNLLEFGLTSDGFYDFDCSQKTYFICKKAFF